MTKDELKTDEPKYIRELIIRDKVRNEAEELIQRFEIANSMNCYMQLTPDRKQIGEMLVMIAEPREKRIAELEQDNYNANCNLALITGKLDKAIDLLRMCQNTYLRDPELKINVEHFLQENK